MKVGYVLKKFPRLSETFILNEILGLEAMGVEIEIYTLRPADDEPRHNDLGRLRASVHLLDAATTPEGAAERAAELLELFPAEPEKIRRRCLRQGAQLADLARLHGIDHLHAHFMTGSARVAAIAHQLGGPGFTVTCHAKDIFRRDIDARLFHDLSKRAWQIVTVSEFNRSYIAERFLAGRDDRITMIYNGLPLDEPSFQTMTMPRDRRLVLSVGRLVEKKGFDLLLRAARLLRDQGHDLEFVLVGEGETRPALEKLRGELDLDSCVKLTGSLAREEVILLMRRAGVFVLPCRESLDGNCDALPTVLIEALAVGLPAISTRMVGIPEIIGDDDQGRLVPVEDSAALAEAISSITSDDEAFSRMSMAGPQRARERFDRSRTLPRLLALFTEAAQRHSAVGEHLS